MSDKSNPSFEPTQLDTQHDILQYIVDTKTASEIWGITEARVKQLAINNKIIAKKLRTVWAIDIRQPNPKIYKRNGEM